MNAWTDAQYEKNHPVEWFDETEQQTHNAYNALV